MEKVYDLIILGAGPAGLAAGLYAGRARLDTLIIEKGQDGGQIAITNEIENYPGQRVDMEESGPSLIARMTEQVKHFGADRVSDTIKSVDLKGDVKTLVGNKGTYQAKAVILATGAFPRPIGCENEGKFVGKGISFCATCDANFFEDFEVFVVGGGDSAVEEAMYLTKFARKVTIIHRRDELRAAKSIQEKAFKNEKLHFMWDSVVESVGSTDGDDGMLNTMVVKNVKTGETTTVNADEEDGLFGLFGFIGLLPKSDLFKGQVELDDRVKVSLTVRYENDTYYLAFKVAGTIVIPCDRCLDDMEHSLDTEYSVKVKYGQEYSEDNDELIVIPESEANFNVANLIYDTVALTIPLKHVHPAGMCNKEMAAQLKLHSSSLRDEDDEYGYYDEEDDEEETSGSEEENEEKETDPRWAALKNIKLENN